MKLLFVIDSITVATLKMLGWFTFMYTLTLTEGEREIRIQIHAKRLWQNHTQLCRLKIYYYVYIVRISVKERRRKKLSNDILLSKQKEKTKIIKIILSLIGQFNKLVGAQILSFYFFVLLFFSFLLFSSSAAVVVFVLSKLMPVAAVCVCIKLCV